MGDAKELYQTVGDSVNETLDRIKEIYSGAGSSGGMDIDLTPRGTDTGKPSGAASAINDMLSSANSGNEGEDVGRIIKEKMSIAAELFEKYGNQLMDSERIWKVNDPQMLELANRQFSMMLNPVQTVPECVRSKDIHPVINVHYDNMINVEGSVDKSFSKEFTQNTDKLFDEFTNQLTKKLKHHGVNFVRRPTLPMVR